MKVLLVNGSPKKANTTFAALQEVERALNAQGIDTEIVQLGNGPIGGCIGCGACRKTGLCFMDDCVNVFPLYEHFKLYFGAKMTFCNEI